MATAGVARALGTTAAGAGKAAAAAPASPSARAVATATPAAAAANNAAAAATNGSAPTHPPIDGLDDEHWRPHALLTAEARAEDWVAQLSAQNELDGAHAFDPDGDARSSPPRYLVLYGSLRERSYSRLLAYEFARLLEALGGRVRVFDPRGLPVQGSCDPEASPKVQELRALAIWAQGFVWVSPEQHGTLTAVFKNQIDWIPLSLGSVRPTQGRTLALAQVCGGSQSFNTTAALRLLGRYMRCITIPNQSSIPKAWTEFTPEGRLLDTSYRSRVVDVAEELHKFTLLTRGRSDFLTDRYSERREVAEKGRLLSQAEKEAEKKKAEAAAAAEKKASAA
jgi:arsenic resistance protein ArsH